MINKHEVQSIGLTTIPNAVDPKLCAECVRIMNNIATGPTIWNWFQYSPIFLGMLENIPLHNLMLDLIDPDYVLIANNAQNRCTRHGADKHTGRWHVDARDIQGRVIPGLSYIAITLLEDFTAANGATWYVPRSHEFHYKPDPKGDYPSRQILGKAGDIVVYDSALWHRGGPVTEASRWGVFTIYGPWFMKPYFWFPSMLDEDQLSPHLSQIFHFKSTPPKDDAHGKATLERVRKEEIV